MNKEKFNELCRQSGFKLVRCLDKNYRLVSPNELDIIDDNLESLKDLLLDEVIKEAKALIKWQTRFGAPADPLVYEYNAAIADLIEKVEAMK